MLQSCPFPPVPAKAAAGQRGAIMTTIIGVDFSGAERENKTWIARGVLTEDGTL